MGNEPWADRERNRGANQRYPCCHSCCSKGDIASVSARVIAIHAARIVLMHEDWALA
jgi:predicted amino acid dehydrogenase